MNIEQSMYTPIYRKCHTMTIVGYDDYTTCRALSFEYFAAFNLLLFVQLYIYIEQHENYNVTYFRRNIQMVVTVNIF